MNREMSRSRAGTILHAGTCTAPGTEVALRAALDYAEREGVALTAIVPKRLRVVAIATAPNRRVVRRGRPAAVLGELAGVPSASIYIGLADRLPLVRRPGVSYVLVIQNQALVSPTTARGLNRVLFALKRWWLRRSVTRADRIVAATDDAVDRLVALVPPAHRGAALDKCVVHPIVPTIDVVPRRRPSDGRWRIVLVGAVRRYKHFARTIELIDEWAHRQGRSVEIVHIGQPGDGSTALDDAAAALGAASFTSRGALAHGQTMDVLAAADVFVLMSASETFGIPVAEALMLGVPTICSDLAVFRDVAGTAAQFCPLDPPGPFWRALDQLSTARGHREWSERTRARGDELRAIGSGWNVFE